MATLSLRPKGAFLPWQADAIEAALVDQYTDRLTRASIELEGVEEALLLETPETKPYVRLCARRAVLLQQQEFLLASISGKPDN